MRIDGNRSDGQSQLLRAENAEKQQKENSEKERGSIKASDLNLMQDDGILGRKKKAMADAMDLIGKQFEADGKIDDDLAKRRERIGENKKKAEAALKEKQALDQEKEKLRESYGVEADSEEQADLELQIKFRKAMKPGSNVQLTEEEFKRLQESKPLTDYQKQALEIEASKGVWQEEIDEAHKQIAVDTQVIRATKQELLKYHGMTDAVKAAEATLEAASDEIKGMLIAEGMDHVKEEVDEAVEKAQEQKEEKEEQKALREEQKARQEEQNQQLQELPDVQRAQTEVEQKLQEILERQKLLEEDLKGIQVDNII